MSAVQLRDPVGVGIAFPPHFNERGGLALTASTYVEFNQINFGSGNRKIRVLRANDDEQRAVIFNSITRILETPTGTRFMNGAYGSRVSDIPFEPNNIVFRNTTLSFATLAIQLNEPRVSLVGASAVEADAAVVGDGLAIQSTLQYRIAGADVTSALVVPIKPGGSYVNGL